MIAYHGSNAIFDKFDSEYFNTGTGNEQYGAGFYFTSSEEQAKSYGSAIYKVNLELKNPYILDSTQRIDDIKLSYEEVLELIKQHPNAWITSDEPYDEYYFNPVMDYVDSYWEWCRNDIDNPDLNRNLLDCIVKTAEMIYDNESPTLMSMASFYDMTHIKEQRFLEIFSNITGHDGLIINNEKDGSSIYVAWNSDQIEIEKIKLPTKQKQTIERD